MAAQLLVVHPNLTGLERYAGLVNQQNQNVKTDMYVGTFVVILPLALLAGLRLVGTIARGANAGALPAFAAALTGSLAALLVAHPPIGPAAVGFGRQGDSRGRARMGGAGRLGELASCRREPLGAVGGAPGADADPCRSWPPCSSFCVLLCLTSSASLGLVPLVIGVAVAAGAVAAYGRVAAAASRALGLGARCGRDRAAGARDPRPDRVLTTRSGFRTACLNRASSSSSRTTSSGPLTSCWAAARCSSTTRSRSTGWG